MRVLIISTNTLFASPAGPAYVAGAALQDGHDVDVFDCYFAQDIDKELAAKITRFQPEVCGISIRLVNGKVVTDYDAPWAIQRFDVRPTVREVADCIRRTAPNAKIILGGPGFNYYGPNWLEYLDLDYGLRGEADFTFPQYLDMLANGGDIYIIAGCVYRKNGGWREVERHYRDDLDSTGFPAYQLFDLDRYQAVGIAPAISTKRGCAMGCTFCPYARLEGTRYRVKSPKRVVDEIEYVYAACGPRTLSFCDNSFNIPLKHGKAICREIIERGNEITWSTGALKPIGINPTFVNLMLESGCQYVNLAVESASPTMLGNMHRGYSVRQIREAMTSLSNSDLPFGMSIMLGAPGESPETVAETFAVVDSFPTPPGGVWVSIGINMWTEYQQIIDVVRESGQLTHDAQLFDGVDYLSPELPKDYMEDLINNLAARDGYTVQVNKAHATA
ncbi:MAG: radical SAM protein [Anaerolineaceae bacterium]|nr:radical SAM protein [Anaerolineaceae bacterium]